jgi:hypothetical protein
MSFVYYDKNNQIAMIAKGKIKAPAFTILEVDDDDPAIVKQQANGGQLFVENGKIEYRPFENKPLDAKKEILGALKDAKDFDDFKKKLVNRLI